MFAKIAFFCAALVAVSAYAPLVNTGVSAVSNQQDAYGNYAYRYDIKDTATGSLNSKAEVGKVGAVAVAAPAVAYGAYAAPAIAAPLAYGGVVGHGGALGLGYGNALGLGYGGAIGLGHGAGILGAGLGKVIL